MSKRLLSMIVALILAAALSSCAGFQSLFGAEPKPTESGPPTAPPAQSDGPAPATDSGAATESPEASVTSEPPADQVASVASVTDDKFDYTSDYIETTVGLPKVSGLGDAAAQDRVNAVFEAYMAAVKKDNTTYEAESKQLAEDGQSSAIPYQIAVGYSVPYNRDGILSVLISDYRYLGGAHGGELWVAHTFDLKKGRELGLNDLMQAGSGYRAYLNGVIRKEIDSRAAAGALDELVPFSDIGDNPAFFLTPSSMIFYFQEYEYFPYAAGIQRFEIPYDDLAGMLKPEYAALELKPVRLRPNIKNALIVGDIGEVRLDGNMSTGYAWTYEISGDGALELAAHDAISTAKPGMVGGGETYYWDFRALTPGAVTITFKYIPAFSSQSSPTPEDTVRVTVDVH